MISLFMSYFLSYTRTNKNLNLTKSSKSSQKKELIQISKQLDNDKTFNIISLNWLPILLSKKTYKILTSLKLLWTPVPQIFTLLTLYISISTPLLIIGINNPLKMFRSSLINNSYLKWTCIVQIDFQEFNSLKEWWLNKKISQCSRLLKLKRVSLKVKMILMILLMELKDIQFHLRNIPSLW